MPKPKKGASQKVGRPVTVPNGEKVTVRLDGATLEQIAKVREHSRFGSKTEILRKAIALGLEQILRDYQKR
jgi:Arc/MetJ-type ribon-helix-helix transcriptional regulator